jgi:hypothetical protein
VLRDPGDCRPGEAMHDIAQQAACATATACHSAVNAALGA